MNFKSTSIFTLALGAFARVTPISTATAQAVISSDATVSVKEVVEEMSPIQNANVTAALNVTDIVTTIDSTVEDDTTTTTTEPLSSFVALKSTTDADTQYSMLIGVHSVNGIVQLEGNGDYSDVFVVITVTDSAGATVTTTGTRDDATDGNAKTLPLVLDKYATIMTTETTLRTYNLIVEVWDRNGSTSTDAQLASPTWGSDTSILCSGYPLNTLLNTSEVEGVQFTGIDTTSNGYKVTLNLIKKCSKALPLATGTGTIDIWLQKYLDPVSAAVAANATVSDSAIGYGFMGTTAAVSMGAAMYRF